MTIFITFLASGLIWLMFVSAGIYYWRRPRRKGFLLRLGFSVSLAFFLTQLVKRLIPYSVRPFRLNGFPPLTLTLPADSSFPSDHTAIAFALAVALCFFNKKLGLTLIIAAVLVGTGRIMGNVHFPLDILGGALVGTFSSLLVDYRLKKEDLP